VYFSCRQQYFDERPKNPTFRFVLAGIITTVFKYILCICICICRYVYNDISANYIVHRAFRAMN
jgi:hypothetical protein